jgi:beta-glucosidase
VIADVLLGVADPGGRLPQTWPLRIQETVAFGDARQYPGVDGHVAYGEGLSIGYRHHEAHGITANRRAPTFGPERHLSGARLR